MENYIYFESEAIEDFIKSEGRGGHTKDYELVAAVAMKNFCERQWGEPCRIGFPITPETARRITGTEPMSFKDVVGTLRCGRMEDSPVDFAVASTRPAADGKKAKGMYVQTKRFGRGIQNPNTDALITLLKSLRYQKLPITLLVVSEPGGIMEYKRVQEAIDPVAFPFERLLIFGAHDNLFTFISLFPETGMEEYDMDSFFT